MPHFKHSLFLLSITILLEPTKPQHQQQSAGNRPLSILVTAAKCSRKSFTAQQKKNELQIPEIIFGAYSFPQKEGNATFAPYYFTTAGSGNPASLTVRY